MAAPKKVGIIGVEKLRYAPASPLGVVAVDAWKEISGIAMGSFVHTENTAPKTDIPVEETDVPFASVYGVAEGDTIAFGVLNRDPDFVNTLYGTKYTPATSTTAFKANKKVANIALELTTRSLEGIKTIQTFYNTDAVTSKEGAITKDGAQSMVITATLKAYRPAGETEDFIYESKLVTSAGVAIDSSAA